MTGDQGGPGINRCYLHLPKNNLYRYFIIFVLFVACLCPETSFSQQKQINALRLKLRLDSARIFRPRKVMLLLSLDRRNTFLETKGNANTPVDLAGVKVGLTLHNQHKTGIGYYSFRHTTTKITYPNGQTQTIGYKFNYFTAFYEYYFIHTHRWDLGIPFEVGMGRYSSVGLEPPSMFILSPCAGFH